MSMQIDPARLEAALTFFTELRLLSGRERAEVLSMLAAEFPWAEAVKRAESFHVHVHVEAVASLPHEQIRGHGARAQNEKDGYVKYAFGGGLNLIFSSIDVAEDDRLPTGRERPRPFVDHMGIDLREDSMSSRAIFDRVPAIAADCGWRHVAQGAPDAPVLCCHVAVAAKHWVYPPASSASFVRPIEVAYGPLEITSGTMGCDLRPLDPALVAAPVLLAASPSAQCCPPAPIVSLGKKS